MDQFGIHPNLTLRAEEGRHQVQSAEEHPSFASQVYGDIDHTPKALALVILASLGVVWGLNALGFRFAFGASGGVGK